MNQLDKLQFEFYIQTVRYIMSQLFSHASHNQDLICQDKLLRAYIECAIDVEDNVFKTKELESDHNE